MPLHLSEATETITITETVETIKAKLFNFVNGSYELTGADKTFIQANPQILSELNVDGMGNTYLLAAIAKNHTASALAIIPLCTTEALAKPDEVDFCRNSPLLLAMKKGNREVALALIEKDPSLVHATDPKGMTPLHWAAILRDDELIKKLLDAGAQDCPCNALAGVPGLTAKELYEKEFTPEDIALRAGGGGPDAENSYHLNMPCLSDLFWHALDVAKNRGLSESVSTAVPLSGVALSDVYTTTPLGRQISAASRTAFIAQRNAVEPQQDVISRLNDALRQPESTDENSPNVEVGTVSPNSPNAENSSNNDSSNNVDMKHEKKGQSDQLLRGIIETYKKQYRSIKATSSEENVSQYLKPKL
ncbi:ankyrin repeat domain-containing protein [Legionella oakridgensis]|uniref:Ankyrin repeat protein n=2 Tax=Legionella oakridgensis TaxID=29423 RepID=W0BGI2_9GAMM|nr:ankyrin repeat domain-containing protein [Legionella oakridgensis]AHE67544.1 ankyrin repeat protein [Legionella oakridgensis ATCC 33761 = DSM 21215]ETO92792.1 ankyrin repeat protein [Legionella oakridgensis RV-2-2007]KTD37101.1 Ankyrin repeat protein [Legionella oakridgensis]STY20589.1 Ankyrin repeat protein [Legionella longbeachae]